MRCNEFVQNCPAILWSLSLNLPLKLIYFLRPRRSGASSDTVAKMGGLGDKQHVFLPYLSRFYLFYFCMRWLHLRDACKLDCFLKHFQLMENLKYTEKQTVVLICILKMNCKYSVLQRLLRQAVCGSQLPPYKVIIVQSESVAKMLFSGYLASLSAWSFLRGVQHSA